MYIQLATLSGNQTCTIWIIAEVCAGTIPDLLDRLVDDEQRHQEPLSGHHGTAEPIRNFDVELCSTENPVDQVFKPGLVDVVELIGRHNLDRRHEEGRLKVRTGNPLLDTQCGHANLVHEVPVLRHHWMIRLAAQDIDRAGGAIAFFGVLISVEN